MNQIYTIRRLMQPRHPSNNTRRGFTLLEMIIAVLIFGSIVAGVSIFILYYLKSYSFSFEEQQSIGYAQYAMTTMLRELREARIGEDGAWPLAQTDDNTIVFYSDVTNDGRTDKVRYFLSGTDLKKGVIQPTAVPVTYPAGSEQIKTIASFIDIAPTPLFKYYNGNWPTDQINNPLASANRLLQTRYITVYLRINVNPTSGSAPYMLNSGVQIRSLKDNL